MAEKALAVPFESPEIIDILCAEFRKRLNSNCHLQGGKAYASFRASFDIGLTLRGVSGIAVDTIAWDKPYRDAVVPDTEGETVLVSIPPDEYTSGEPNAERMKRGMALTVTDKRGNKRKVHVTDAEAVNASPKIGMLKIHDSRPYHRQLERIADALERIAERYAPTEPKRELRPATLTKATYKREGDQAEAWAEVEAASRPPHTVNAKVRSNG